MIYIFDVLYVFFESDTVKNDCPIRIFMDIDEIFIDLIQTISRERSGSMVECLTRDQRAAGSSLTGVTALCP